MHKWLYENYAWDWFHDFENITANTHKADDVAFQPNNLFGQSLFVENTQSLCGPKVVRIVCLERLI